MIIKKVTGHMMADKKNLLKIIICAILLTQSLFLGGCGNHQNEVTQDETGAVEADESLEQNSPENAEETQKVIKPESAANDSVDNIDEQPDAEKDLKAAEEKIKSFFMEKASANESDILFSHVDDYDRNGTYEGFFFLGNRTGMEAEDYIEGHMWYSDEGKCEQLDGSATDAWWKVDGLLEFNERVYVYATEYYVTGGRSIVWSVYDGLPKEAEISGVGDIGVMDDKGIHIANSTYDSIWDNGMIMGHSWKHYYYYYDAKQDRICEYGGISVAYEDIDSMVGFNLTEKIEANQRQITTAYYRENGILNINYLEKSDDGSINYGNVNYDRRKAEFVQAWPSEGEGDEIQLSDFNGIYWDALTPELATYPSMKLATQNISLVLLNQSCVIPGNVQIQLNGVDNSDWGHPVSVVVDENTVYGNVDDSNFYKREKDMTPMEWMISLADFYSEDGTNDIAGVYDLVVTGNHVDVMNGTYYWD